MKKVICSIVAIMLLLTGCSITAKSNTIEKYAWTLDIVQNQSGQVIASSKKSSFKNENVIEMTAKAQENALIIKDKTNYESYTINYEVVKSTPESTVYKLKVGTAEGNAVVSKTKNGSKKTPTLYMQFKGHSLKFFGSVL